MNGRLEGRFDQAATQLARGYRQVPSGRLVVLGEPGAGKTVLALMLTLGLLRDRDPAGPVPVLLSVSTWDPVTQSLDDWIVDTLATAYYGTRPDIPRRLLDRRLLLPILDGLDEIPEVARRTAVRALNHAYGDGRGVVLTCRSTEYEDVIEGGSPVLRRAPVVEVAPVSVSDGLAYLQDVTWPAGIDWEPVYEHVRRDPASSLATALSTPLTLSLARTVYRHCNRDPRELLDFDSRHGVEDHLIDHVITAAYAPPSAGVEQAADDEEWRRRAERAERWLTYIATYLHTNRERDLAWWLMSRRLLSRWFGIAFGIALGVTMMITVTAVLHVAHSMDPLRVLVAAIVVGAGSAVLTMLTWYAVPDQAPGRLSIAVGGSLKRLRRGFATGIALVSIPALPLLATAAAVITATSGWSASGIAEFFRVVTVVVTLAGALALALAVHNWLDAPSERSTGASPLGFLRQDRKSSLMGASIAGVVLSITGVPLLILGTSAGWIALHALTGSLSRQPSPVAVVSKFAGADGYFSTPALTIAWMLLTAVIFALQVLVTRAWPKFALLHLVLAARGRLPWSLTGFLADARERQLLRQSAGAYQFRHIRLQERLADRSPARDREPQPRARTIRRLQATVACVALILIGLTLVRVLPKDSSHAMIFTGHLNAMAFSTDGKTLTTVSGRKVRRWNTDNGKELTSYRAELDVNGEGSELDVQSLALRADGSLVIAALVDDLNWRVGQWDGAWRKLPAPLFGDRAALGAGGNFVAVSGATGILVTNLHTGQVVHKRSSGQPVALSADGSVLLTEEDGQLTVTNFRDVQKVPPAPVSVAIPDRIEMNNAYALAMNADGTQVATAQGYKSRIWNATGKKDGQPVTGPTEEIEHLALSPDGRLMAATADGTTRLWRLKTS